ncbi:TetR/AcrR family transcriptional regulator [Mycobacterium sp. AT1]|uniref:TetR/AcrR family transcriptional regulator n=1 Tax=Mycobacterium sp. AT1 TaxID=1961706 RepID=UPI0009ACD23B|nr:TetR/AcrR family transcriptional regulator [Mycobacterium sp. AT1]OPX13275.1 TetR family transcriptional regulator [Mycobacterium sp. AT1]
MTEVPQRRPRGRPGYSRDEVLQRAIALFNVHGYDATSINDLARHLGVTKSAVFYHFESKESILAAALDEALDGLEQAVSAATGAASDTAAYERLRATVASSVHILVAHLPAVTLLLRIRGNSALEVAAVQRRRGIDDQLTALVQEAAREGSLRADIEPEVISRLIFGMVNSLAEWYRPDGPIDESQLAAKVTGMLVDGLRAPSYP